MGLLVTAEVCGKYFSLYFVFRFEISLNMIIWIMNSVRDCFIFTFYWPFENSFQCNSLAVLIFCMVSSFKKCNFCIGPHCWRYLTMGWTSFFFIITYLMSGDIRKCTLNVKIYQKYQENTVAKNVSLKMISSNCATFYGQGEFWLIFLPLLLLLPHFINNGTKLFMKSQSIKPQL